MLSQHEPTADVSIVQIAIVDDNDTIREGLVELINASEGFSCVGAYRTAEEALAEIVGKQPDVILMDINLPGMSGIECTRQVKAFLPKVQVMMLTVYENDEHVFPALKAGATGYLVKRTKPEKLLAAITELREGGSPMSAEIARKIVQTFHEEQTIAAEGTETLTKREREILGHLAKGLRYKEIAERMFISPSTVRSHIHKVYEKLHVRSKSEAILKVLRK
jgi:DNA-binding NarL/FixJ family response regulator